MEAVVQIKERRAYPRVSANLLDSNGQDICNLSQTGLYLQSSKRYHIQQNLPVSFTLVPGDSSVNLKGTVVRHEVIGSDRFGYGLRLKEISGDDLKKLQDFLLSQKANKEDATSKEKQRNKSVFYKKFVFKTQQQNLTAYDPRLASYLLPSDCFSIYDLTKNLQDFVHSTGVVDGTLTIQILHTSATLCINELDEPMLLMDLVVKLRDFAPKNAQYFHNGPMRTVNLCADDSHCDRNADAHVKSALFGQATVSLIIKDGILVLGQWQRVALLEFDGPRKREVLVQLNSF